MTQNRFYSSDALPTTLAAAITSSGATSMSVNSVTGNPSSFPFTMLIDWGASTQEAVSVTASTGSGPYTLTITRGIDGTTAQTHVNGAVVVHGVSAEDYNEPQVHIATGTSGSAYPNVIHGLANGSSVVGTTDTQTLTNKTLGATSVTGAVTSSVSSTAGAILSVTNTHSAPTNANVSLTAAASTDKAIDSFVSGDTDARYEVLASGKTAWGAGGSSATDTNLYRNAAGELKTDESLTIAGNATVGGAQLLAGGTGVAGFVNASVAPSTTPSGGAVVYAKNGFMKWRGADGLDYNSGHTRAYLSSPFTTANTSGAQTVTGMSLVLGAFTYELELWAPYVGAGTVGSTGVWAFTFGGTTTTVGLVGQFRTSAYTAPTYISTITTGFTSPTLTSTDTLFYLKGMVIVATTGTLQLTITNTTNADETSVLAGSFLKATVVA